MSILKNAIDSIDVGLEDFSSSDQRRLISCARNVFAGILLLFKHKLSLLSEPGSDEVLIKQKILPAKDQNGKIIWQGKGKKTVDVQSIRERFSSLGIVVDWERLDRINEFRNDIEHYYSTLTHETIHSLISNSFIVIRDFVVDELGLDPKDLFSEKSWSTLINISEIYEKEKAECKSTVEQLYFYGNGVKSAFLSCSCEECGSELITAIKGSTSEAIDADFLCKACSRLRSYEEIVNYVVSEHYAYDAYLSMTDGGETPIVDCPSCIDGCYIFENAVCASCGYSAEHECQRCGCSIPPEEIGKEIFCGYCLHMINKDD